MIYAKISEDIKGLRGRWKGGWVQDANLYVEKRKRREAVMAFCKAI